jgi:hypothetical protein
VLGGLNSKALQVVDLTTGSGSGAIATTDPVWSVTLPNGSVQNAIISNGNLWSGSVLYSPGYPTNACGRWISPFTITSGVNTGAIGLAGSPAGDYVYTRTFTASQAASSAQIFLTLAGGDNSITNISVNGYNHPLNLSFNPLAANVPITISPVELLCGNNVIRVTVRNNADYTGLFLCGALTINNGGSLAPLITGNTNFCSGTPLTFTGSDISGTAINTFWEIAECDQNGIVIPGGFGWNNNGGWYAGKPGVFTFPANVNPPCGKYYKIKLALTNNCERWVEKNKVIFINCLPPATTGPNVGICKGACVQLGVPFTMMGSTYSWAPSTGLSATNIENPRACPATTTTYTLTESNSITGCSKSNTVTVTVYEPITATIVSSQPVGCTANYTLTANASNSLNVTYLWNTGATTKSITVPNPSAVTVYSVKISNPCFSGSASTTVYPCYYPKGTFPTLITNSWFNVNWSGNCVGSHCFLQIADPNFALYAGPAYNASRLELRIFNRWGNQLHYQVEDISTYPACAGAYNGILTWSGIYNGKPVQSDVYVWKVDLYNCTGAHIQQTGHVTVMGTQRLFDAATSIADEQATDEFQVYPNPSNGIINIQTPDDSEGTVEVYNALGTKIKSMELNGAEMDRSVDLSHHPKGIYMLNIITAGKKYIRKVIIE